MKLKVSNPKRGDARTIRRFLLFPRVIGNEMRWLCWVNIQQEYEDIWTDDGWKDRCFIDEKI